MVKKVKEIDNRSLRKSEIIEYLKEDIVKNYPKSIKRKKNGNIRLIFDREKILKKLLKKGLIKESSGKYFDKIVAEQEAYLKEELDFNNTLDQIISSISIENENTRHFVNMLINQLKEPNKLKLNKSILSEVFNEISTVLMDDELALAKNVGRWNNREDEIDSSAKVRFILATKPEEYHISMDYWDLDLLKEIVEAQEINVKESNLCHYYNEYLDSFGKAKPYDKCKGQAISSGTFWKVKYLFSYLETNPEILIRRIIIFKEHDDGSITNVKVIRDEFKFCPKTSIEDDIEKFIFSEELFISAIHTIVKKENTRLINTWKKKINESGVLDHRMLRDWISNQKIVIEMPDVRISKYWIQEYIHYTLTSHAREALGIKIQNVKRRKTVRVPIRFVIDSKEDMSLMHIQKEIKKKNGKEIILSNGYKGYLKAQNYENKNKLKNPLKKVNENTKILSNWISENYSL